MVSLLYLPWYSKYWKAYVIKIENLAETKLWKKTFMWNPVWLSCHTLLVDKTLWPLLGTQVCCLRAMDILFPLRVRYINRLILKWVSNWWLAHQLMFCFFLLLEFVELIKTDKEFQMKVDGISAAVQVLGGTVLTRRGCKYNTTTPESN